MKPPFRSNRARLGFTLIELMVVLVLIGIMTAMIIPEMKGTYENALLRSTSRKLVNVINLASSRAIALNQPHRVRLDLRTGRYIVERPARDGEGASGFAPARDVPAGEGKLDSRIAIEFRAAAEALSDPIRENEAPSVAANNLQKPSQDQILVFYPDGTADGTEIVLRDRDGFRLGLRINPVTARVHVVELEHE